MNRCRPRLCALSMLLLSVVPAAWAQTDMEEFWTGIRKIHVSHADSAIAVSLEALRTKVRPDDHVNRSHAHYWIASCYLKMNQDSARRHSDLSLASAQRAGRPVLEAKALQLQGSIDNRDGEFAAALAHLEKGLAVLATERDTLPKEYHNVKELLLRGMSTSYNRMDKDSAAMVYALRAVSIAQRHGLDYAEMAGLVSISSLYHKMKKFDEAIGYAEQALKSSIRQNNESSTAKCHTNLAIFLMEQGRFAEAEEHQRKGLEISIRTQNFDSQTNSHLSLGLIMMETGRLDGAIEHFLQAERIVKEMGYELHLLDLLVNMSMAYNRKGMHREALAKAEELIGVATAKSRPDKLVRGYRMKFDALYGLGQYKEAVDWLERSVALADSIKATENEASLQELMVKFETEKKEEELRRITSEAEVKDLLIQKRNIQLMAGGAGAVALLVLGLLLFRSYRIRSEFELLDLKQRFYRAQINPHFLFNALGSVQGFFYDRTDPNKAAGYLSRLSKLMRQILENTFDNEVTLAEEVSLMENYLEIQKVRMSDRFDYAIAMEDDLGDIAIPSMITQPFLENAVEHGFKELTDRKGHISVRTEEQDGMLRIIIEDNGTGLADHAPKTDHRSRAMQITRERLQLLERTKGRKAHFTVTDNRSTGGVGVTVIIELPA
jgi:tetratricopeptide (TPR) repeat protein/anti-sigma regulatory factor (Ser/Thr protein kinase)